MNIEKALPQERVGKTKRVVQEITTEDGSVRTITIRGRPDQLPNNTLQQRSSDHLIPPSTNST